MIQLARPWIEDGDCSAVVRVLRSGNLVQGVEVAAFEEAVADLVGADYAIACSSGTASLHLALKALAVGQDDIVLVPAYSFPATANVVLHCNSRLRFVDIDEDTFCMSPAALDEALIELEHGIGSAAGRRVVMPVHAFGQCARMEDILRIAGQHGADVVEDAACALGATRNGLAAGMWGAMGCFSFHPMKLLTTGEGGMIVTSDARLAKTLRLLRNHGMVREAGTTRFEVPGFNYRMSETEAALGSAQARRLGAMLEERRAAAARYDGLLRQSVFRTPLVETGNTHTFQSYVVVLPPDMADDRHVLMERARSMGIELGIGTFHMPDLEAFQDAASPACDASSALSRATVSLPMFHDLTESDQTRVADCLLGFASGSA